MTVLGQRLGKAAGLVTPGAFLADVGTDHAYLPVFLAERGLIKGAVASDINKGPLSRAEENIKNAGFDNIITTVLTDGLDGLEKFGITDAVIAGMGGLLIIEILKRARFLCERKIHLVLQPMRNERELRLYLCENGFSIQKEDIASEGKFVYTLISAVYTGEKYTYSDIELLLGKYCIEHRDSIENFGLLCKKNINALKKKADGLEKSGQDASVYREMLKKIIGVMKK